jgi:Flp pilus assembly protein CpaB
MNQARNSRRLVAVGAIIVILVLALGMFFMTRGGSSPSTAAAPRTQPVVVAQQVVPQGTTFRAGQPIEGIFTVKQLPADDIPFEAYHSLSDIKNVLKSASCESPGTSTCVGQVTTTETIYQNLPVVSGMFTTLGQYRVSSGPSFEIPVGHVGIALNLNEGNDVLGSIQSGDTIDLIGTYNGQSSKSSVKAPPQTQYLMTDLKVIGVGGPPPTQSSTGATTTSSSTSSSSTTSASGTGGSLLILATYQDALIIQHLKDTGWQISAVLRSARESTIPHFKTVPVTDKWFFVKSSDPFKTNPGY